MQHNQELLDLLVTNGAYLLLFILFTLHMIIRSSSADSWAVGFRFLLGFCGSGWFFYVLCSETLAYPLFHSGTCNMKLARFLSWVWWTVAYGVWTDSVPRFCLLLEVPFSLLHLGLQQLMLAYRRLRRVGRKNPRLLSGVLNAILWSALSLEIL